MTAKLRRWRMIFSTEWLAMMAFCGAFGTFVLRNLIFLHTFFFYRLCVFRTNGTFATMQIYLSYFIYMGTDIHLIYSKLIYGEDKAIRHIQLPAISCECWWFLAIISRCNMRLSSMLFANMPIILFTKAWRKQFGRSLQVQLGVEQINARKSKRLW